MENYTPKTNAADAARKCNKVGEVTLELREITPRMAALMLMSNFEGNRKIRKTVVRAYATDMREGRWEPTTNSVIQIGTDGRVYDGQHRLNAVVLANSTVPMYVNLAADPSEYMAYDNGAVRKESDVVPVANATASQALCKFIAAAEYGVSPLATALQNRVNTETHATRALVRKIMQERDDEVQRHIAMGRRMRDSLGVGAIGDYNKFCYLVRTVGEDCFLEEFVDEVCSNVSASRIVTLLRETVLKKAAASGARITRPWMVGTLLQGYEAYLNDVDIKCFNKQERYLAEYDKRLKAWREANQTEA